MFFHKFKEKISLKKILYLAVILLWAVTAVLGGRKLFHRTAPENPIKAGQTGSAVLLAGSDDDALRQMKAQGVTIPVSTAALQSGQVSTDSAAADNTAADESSDTGSAGSSQLDPETQSKDKVLDQNGEGDNQNFFTTSIIDGEIVAKETYPFKVTQKEHKYKLQGIQVSTNGAEASFAGSVQLQNGRNTIAVTCSYLDENNQPLTAAKEYTVTLSQKTVITTSLQDNTRTRQPELTFTASAKQGTQAAALKAVCNDSELTPADGNTYTASLQEGENLFTLSAGEQSAEFHITYEKDGKAAEDPAVDEKQTPDQDAPVITISGLSDNQQFVGDSATIMIEAHDHAGADITPGEAGEKGHFILKVNGEALSYRYTNPGMTTYVISLQNGVNKVEVTAIDKDRVTTVFPITVYAQNKKQGDKIGTAYISVDASTVGLGYIIPKTEIDIHQGVSAAEEVKDLLANAGYTPEYQQAGSSFYLQKIKTDDGRSIWPAGGPVIPEGIKKVLLTENWGYDPDDNPADPQTYRLYELGEKQITTGSGWMYFVNGTYPNAGFGEYYMKDGDTLQLRFTLVGGRDLGGSGSVSSGAKTIEW